MSNSTTRVRLHLSDPDRPTTRRRSWLGRQGRRLLTWWAATPQRRYEAWVEQQTHRSQCIGCNNGVRYWKTKTPRVMQCHTCDRWLILPAEDSAPDQLQLATPADRIHLGLREHLGDQLTQLKQEVHSLRVAVAWILGIMLLVVICSCLFSVTTY